MRLPGGWTVIPSAFPLAQAKWRWLPKRVAEGVLVGHVFIHGTMLRYELDVCDFEWLCFAFYFVGPRRF